MIMATVTNPSARAIVIPGHDDEIYGNYWYAGETLVGAPECGTGFWMNTIEIPAGETADLGIPVPQGANPGQRYTVAIVYSGLGSTAAESEGGADWIRHPDRALGCRKVEADVILPAK